MSTLCTMFLMVGFFSVGLLIYDGLCILSDLIRRHME